jgi:hypothetical protein
MSNLEIVGKTKDGRYLYKAICTECGNQRPACAKKYLNKRCRRCTAKIKDTVHLQSADVRGKAAITLVRKSGIDENDFIISNGKKAYAINCPDCNTKLYRPAHARKQDCRECYRKKCEISRVDRIQKQLKQCIKSNLRHRLKRRSIKIIKPYLKHLSFTVEELSNHLEANFQPNMSWDNYGEWHVDHIVPDSWFTYFSPEDEYFKKSWSLDNLQPMWAKDNISKGNRFAGRLPAPLNQLSKDE